MKLLDMPLLIDTPFAKNATSSYVRTIPDTTVVAGAASYDLGFPPLTAQPVSSGGIPPDIKDFNGILLSLSQWTNWLNAGAPVSYDATFATITGGYPRDSILLSTVTAGKFWRSTVDNNLTDPDGGSPVGWEPMITAGSMAPLSVATASLQANAVTNAKLADGPASTVKGRAASGVTTDLTMTQLGSLLPAFVGDSGSGGTKGLVPAPGAGAAAAAQVLLASGGFGAVDISKQFSTIASNANGSYIKIGSWYLEFGIIASVPGNSTAPITFPFPFPTACRGFWGGRLAASVNSNQNTVYPLTGASQTTGTLANTSTGGVNAAAAWWVAIGD